VRRFIPVRSGQTLAFMQESAQQVVGRASIMKQEISGTIREPKEIAPRHNRCNNPVQDVKKQTRNNDAYVTSEDRSYISKTYATRDLTCFAGESVRIKRHSRQR
jgi:hypothetical protein